MTSSSTALLTDHYELTMLSSALRDDTADRPCVFEVFARRLPDGRRYGVVGGTARLLDAIARFRFDRAELDQLAAAKVVDDRTLAWLADYEFTGDVDGYPEGELYFPGSPILTVADPTDLKLTLYVLEADLARVGIGQSVSVHADGFADRAFLGRVKTIANRAEFTPRNIQTPRDRQNLVFAVTVRVPNPDGALKAGLPVDATFGQ